MFPAPLGQLLVPEPLRWSRWKGDCTQLWKSQLSGLSQNKALQNIMFVWSAFSLGNGNLISVSQCPVFGTTHFDLPRSGPQWFLLFGPVDEAGSCPQLDLKPGRHRSTLGVLPIYTKNRRHKFNLSLTSPECKLLKRVEIQTSRW